MPYIKFNDLNMFYEEFGRGEALIFLHSHFSRGLLAFSGQILQFSGNYRCFFPDFRGHGRTVCKGLDWNSRAVADDMADFIDALDIRAAHLIGYSFGTYVGCYMASKYPEKVKSLVTIGGGAYPRPDGADDFLPGNLLKNGETEFIEDMKIRHYDAHKGDWRTYLENTVADWKSHPNLTDDEWKMIKCLALFINGENDTFGTCKELQDKVPHSKAYEVKGSGHRPHFVGEQADLVNKIILDFLEEIK